MSHIPPYVVLIMCTATHSKCDYTYVYNHLCSYQNDLNMHDVHCFPWSQPAIVMYIVFITVSIKYWYRYWQEFIACIGIWGSWCESSC